MVDAAPELDGYDVVFVFKLGGGSFRKLELSLDVGGEGGGVDDDDCAFGEEVPVVGLFIVGVVLFILPLGSGA